MRFEVFNSAPREAEELVRLRLILEPSAHTEDNKVILRAVDAAGKLLPNGNLLVFTSRGVFHKCDRVNKTLGFELDSAGRIKEA
ncbi:MAG: hypothetical protein PHQ43_14805 [Dehalococcoidales bacterium]|nr:hypothetical protein [Dehalococcoidales bacterium]